MTTGAASTTCSKLSRGEREAPCSPEARRSGLGSAPTAARSPSQEPRIRGPAAHPEDAVAELSDEPPPQAWSARPGLARPTRAREGERGGAIESRATCPGELPLPPDKRLGRHGKVRGVEVSQRRELLVAELVEACAVTRSFRRCSPRSRSSPVSSEPSRRRRDDLPPFAAARSARHGGRRSRRSPPPS